MPQPRQPSESTNRHSPRGGGFFHHPLTGLKLAIRAVIEDSFRSQVTGE